MRDSSHSFGMGSSASLGVSPSRNWGGRARAVSARSSGRMTETAVLASPRYKIRFPDADSLRASQAAESPLLNVEVINHRRAFIGVSPADVVGVDVLPEPQEQFA